MIAFFTFLSLVLILVLAVIQFITLRLVTIAHNKLPTSGARLSHEGPRVGENISSQLETRETLPESQMGELLLFVTSSCSICGRVLEATSQISNYWKDDFKFHVIYDSKPIPRPNAVTLASHIAIREEANLRTRLGIPFVPYALLINRDKYVISKALVNNGTHIESMLEAYTNDTKEKNGK